MKQSKPTKRSNQKKHAMRRFKERFGIELTSSQYKGAIRKIQSGKAKFIERQSVSVTVFKIIVCGIEVVAVYDKSRGRIVTFLTEDMIHIEGE